MSISASLGFYYIIFQYYSEKYVKCWFDGSEDFTLIPKGAFLKYAESFSDVLDIRWQLEEALRTTSIYLLDVDGERITRLKPSIEENDSSSLLKDLEAQKNSTLSSYRRNSVFSNSLQTLNSLF